MNRNFEIRDPIHSVIDCETDIISELNKATEEVQEDFSKDMPPPPISLEYWLCFHFCMRNHFSSVLQQKDFFFFVQKINKSKLSSDIAHSICEYLGIALVHNYGNICKLINEWKNLHKKK